MDKRITSRAAYALIHSHIVFGSYVPKIYIVGDELCWFINAAKRAAFGTSNHIEVMTLEEACKLMGSKMPKNDLINRNINQNGATFPNGRLFCDNFNVFVDFKLN